MKLSGPVPVFVCVTKPKNVFSKKRAKIPQCHVFTVYIETGLAPDIFVCCIHQVKTIYKERLKTNLSQDLFCIGNKYPFFGRKSTFKQQLMQE